MINIDKEYREAIISKYQTKEEIIIRKAEELNVWHITDLRDPTELVALTGNILDNELDKIKENIFKEDKSAYYLRAEAVSILLQATDYDIDTINVDKEIYKMTSSENDINIITTNLVLESNNFSDYTNFLDYFNDGLKVNIVNHPEIDVKQIIEDNDKNTLFKALRIQLTKALNS